MSFLFYTASQAQKGAHMIKHDDPMIGIWKFVTDSTINPREPAIIKGEKIIEIEPGIEVSMVAGSKDSITGFKEATYFLAKKDAHHIYGSIIESYKSALDGTDFSFQYEYYHHKDLLIIIIKGKKYVYKRV